MNLPQMREWAAYVNNLAVRQNTNALCDALEDATRTLREQAKLIESLSIFANLESVWVVWLSDGLELRVIAVAATEDDAERAAAEEKAATLKVDPGAVVLTQRHEPDPHANLGRVDSLIEWDEYTIRGLRKLARKEE